MVYIQKLYGTCSLVIAILKLTVNLPIFILDNC